MSDFPCWLVDKGADGRIESGMARRGLADLPPGEILVRVLFSSLNYKDALAATGNPGVAKRLPQVPGIDAVGLVKESVDPRFKRGDAVMLMGGEFGAGAWGGWSAYARANADLVVPLPAGLTLEEGATLGVAGFTAALSVKKLLDHGLAPGDGEVLVTGATGGVGAIAVMILSRLGFAVVASTGKTDRHEWLRSLGATRVLDRTELENAGSAPLLKSIWAGGLDTVGGSTLATLLRSTRTGGCVTACGLVGGATIELTVHPFILRGITLAGVDSAWTPRETRLELWKRLAGAWKPGRLAEIARMVGLADAAPEIEAILAGRISGRTLIKVST
ncbi:MAG: acryloyl-CoA reductase [Spirochaetota bacterium]